MNLYKYALEMFYEKKNDYILEGHTHSSKIVMYQNEKYLLCLN